MKRNIVLPLLAATWLVGSFSATDARADLTYGFGNISANNVADATTGETQLFVDVGAFTLNSTDGVLFTFRNEGPLASSITDVYFDDGSLLALADLIDADDNSGDPGVDYSQNASPGNLPSANSASPPFEATSGFTADSDPPTQPNGVNPNESLGVFFTLQGGQTVDDVFAELASGALRIGIHVQGFEGGGSESFVNNPEVIPAPGAALLAMMGLGAAGWVRRRFA